MPFSVFNIKPGVDDKLESDFGIIEETGQSLGESSFSGQ